VTFTYLPWAARIEAVLDAQIPRGTSVKIALDALARADTKTRYDGHKIALEAGFLTVDEVRALEDRPPLQPDEVVA
jgi:phage portal protein BeeE